MSVSERLDAIEARKSAATEGPWEWGGTARRRTLEGKGEGILSCAAMLWPEKRNAEFIANAPSDVAYLLDLARKQQVALDAVRLVHAPRTEGSDETYCRHCYVPPYGHAPYPCPTIQAVEGK